MANLQISERRFSQVGLGSAYPIQGKGVANQTLDIGAAVQTTAALNADTQYVSLYAEAKARVTFDGTDPSATVGEYIGEGERIEREASTGTVIKVFAAG